MNTNAVVIVRVDKERRFIALPRSPVLRITPGERAALQLLVEGKTRDELAASLDVSECELDSRLTALFRRMGVRTELEAAAEFIRRGLHSAEYSIAALTPRMAGRHGQ